MLSLLQRLSLPALKDRAPYNRSALAFRSAFHVSKLACIFFSAIDSRARNASGPENSSFWMKVVPPGVVVLGLN